MTATKTATTTPLVTDNTRAGVQVEHRTPGESDARGKATRLVLPPAALAEAGRDPARSDPVALLQEQATTRVPELVPIRYGRMLVSPFTFYRGAARVMASDLAVGPHTDLTVQLCGDAHLLNFGLFGTPERRLVFDLNDFDETLPGPFEWDVKRLIASLEIAGRDNGFSRKERTAVVAAAARRYRDAMTQFAGMRELDVWYLHLEAGEMSRRVESMLDAKRRKRLAKNLDKARTRDSLQALSKLTETVQGQLRIVADPPLIVPISDLFGADEAMKLKASFHTFIRQYRGTLQADRRALLSRFRFVDMARKVVGVGSVGTRCFIILMSGRDERDPLFLQVKEAERSVLAEFLPGSVYDNQGERVVAGQRLVQESSDIFLGWQRTAGIDGVERDFYVRQLRDWKGSAEVGALLPKGLELYGQLCAWSLARAHARSGDRIAIAAYLGDGVEFGSAMGAFADAYADRNEADHRMLAEAVASGRVSAQTGL